MKLLKAVVLNEQAKVYITNTTNVVTTIEKIIYAFAECQVTIQ